MKKRKTQSPLTDKPLRYMGQSLDEEIDDVAGTSVLLPGIISLIYVILAGLEWHRWFVPSEPKPILYTVIAIGAIIYTTIRVAKGIKRIKLLKLGRDGERAVGQYLELLREKGHRVFHDILGKGFNIDHVVVSPKGIFVIETKTYSKSKADAKIIFDGKNILVDGSKSKQDIVTQAKAEVSWISNLLKDSTGKSFPVKPVVVFPGWFVESTKEGQQSEIWALNPKALPNFIDSQPDVISQPDMMLAAFHLSRFIRSL